MSAKGFTYAEIDLGAISHNVSEIKKIIPKTTKFMAVVKANGYGHGAVEVSKAAASAGADYLSVASKKEAMELRDAGIHTPILILSESLPEDAEEIIRAGLTQTVYTVRLAEALSKASAAVKKPALVHLKVDTGMGRIGATPSEAVGLLKKIKNLPGIEVEGAFTHFAKADDTSDTYTAKQLSAFKDFIREAEGAKIFIPLKHAANSAATLYHPDTHFDMVRIGLAMYGLYPQGNGVRVSLKPALSFKTRIMYLKTVPAGTSLSYGCTYRTSGQTGIATLPVGYADGYNRALSNKGTVLIRGKRYPVVGRVCMDMTLVNVGDDHVELGDEAVLIGSQGREKISADEIASLEGTISYEVVCGIGKRVERVYCKSNS